MNAKRAKKLGLNEMVLKAKAKRLERVKADRAKVQEQAKGIEVRLSDVVNLSEGAVT